MTVTLYTQPGCQPCKATYRRLTDKGVEFDVRDVSVSESALEEVRALGYQMTPVVVTESGEHWSGFDPSRIDALAA